MSDPLEARLEEILRGDAEQLAESGYVLGEFHLSPSEKHFAAAWLRGPEALKEAQRHFPAPWSDGPRLCRCGATFEVHSFHAHWLEQLAKALERG
jgi:hypothetical protein